MPERHRSASPPRPRWHRLRSAAGRLLPGERLSDLAVRAALMLLIGLLFLFVVREIREGALTGCPGYDGIRHRREAEALCAEP